MKHDELKDMGHFVPMKKKNYYKHNLKIMSHFLKTFWCAANLLYRFECESKVKSAEE
jgi:hypothetical protein